MAIVSRKVDQPQPATLRMKTSLYVGDLDKEVTSTDLFQVFSQIGTVSSVHLCVDAGTGESLRYGYVNFFFPIDASRALSSLNHTNVRGKPMRIMWCQRNPYPRRAGVTNLFVKNLDPSINSAQLQYTFEPFGTILSCKVVEEDGKSKCFGFVHFEDETSAAAAVSAMHNKMVAGKKLYVARFMSKSQRIAANDEKFTNLYVKNLDEDLTDDALKEKFSEFGTVCNAVIIRDGEGKSKGFGFISFESHEEAKKAAEALNGADFGTKKLFVGRAQKKAERKEILKRQRGHLKILQDKVRASNVYVKHLDPSVDDKILAEHFSPCGRILSAKVMRDDNGISRGFGFVSFSSPSEARIALSLLQGSNLQGKCIFLNIAMQKQERQRALENCSYFMPFSCQGVIPFGSKPPLLLSPPSFADSSQQKAIQHRFKGSILGSNTEHLNGNGVMKLEDYPKASLPFTCSNFKSPLNSYRTGFKDISHNIRVEKLQRGCEESFPCTLVNPDSLKLLSLPNSPYVADKIADRVLKGSNSYSSSN